MNAGGTISMTMVWLIAFVVLLIVEGIIPGLVSIWFAAGALAALLVSLYVDIIWVQGLVFLVVSLALLVLTRPLAKKLSGVKILSAAKACRIRGAPIRVPSALESVAAAIPAKIRNPVCHSALPTNVP